MQRALLARAGQSPGQAAVPRAHRQRQRRIGASLQQRLNHLECTVACRVAQSGDAGPLRCTACHGRRWHTGARQGSGRCASATARVRWAARCSAWKGGGRHGKGDSQGTTWHGMAWPFLFRARQGVDARPHDQKGRLDRNFMCGPTGQSQAAAVRNRALAAGVHVQTGVFVCGAHGRRLAGGRQGAAHANRGRGGGRAGNVHASPKAWRK